MTAPEITIPEEALEAVAKNLRASLKDMALLPAWNELSEVAKEYWRSKARAACLAMLAAWPGMSTGHAHQWSVMPDVPIIILPLQKQEGGE